MKEKLELAVYIYACVRCLKVFPNVVEVVTEQNVILYKRSTHQQSMKESFCIEYLSDFDAKWIHNPLKSK